jgi:hypothetical protein
MKGRASLITRKRWAIALHTYFSRILTPLRRPLSVPLALSRKGGKPALLRRKAHERGLKDLRQSLRLRNRHQEPLKVIPGCRTCGTK